MALSHKPRAARSRVPTPINLTGVRVFFSLLDGGIATLPLATVRSSILEAQPTEFSMERRSNSWPITNPFQGLCVSARATPSPASHPPVAQVWGNDSERLRGVRCAICRSCRFAPWQPGGEANRLRGGASAPALPRVRLVATPLSNRRRLVVISPPARRAPGARVRSTSPIWMPATNSLALWIPKAQAMPNECRRGNPLIGNSL